MFTFDPVKSVMFVPASPRTDGAREMTSNNAATNNVTFCLKGIEGLEPGFSSDRPFDRLGGPE